MSGVRRSEMAQFSFLMVLAPIIGEQLLDVVGSVKDTGNFFSGETSTLCLALGFVAAVATFIFAFGR